MKIKIITLLITAAIFLSGCRIMDFSSLTGRGMLATSDITFPENNETESSSNQSDTNTPSSTLNTESGNYEQASQEPSEDDKEETSTEKENKKGIISFKAYLFTGTAANEIKNVTVVTAENEYESLLSKMEDYANKNNLTKSILDTCFLIAIPIQAESSTWEYSVDSVKNEDKLTVTVLCEKDKDSTGNKTNHILIVAISKNDMPNVPKISQIEVKQNSYTVE